MKVFAHMHWRVIALLALGTAIACGGSGQPEFVWTRKEPAAGRKSPTTFMVRIAVDPAAKTVTWAEDVHDSEGDLGRTMKTWTACTILNESNWECSGARVPGHGEVEHVTMRNGALVHRYWDEDRQYKRRKRLGSVSF